MLKNFKFILTIIPVILAPFLSMAQYQSVLGYLDNQGLYGSRAFPSNFDLGKRDFQVGLGYHFWVANNRIRYSDLYHFLHTKELSSEFVNDLLSQMGNRNVLGIGQDYQVLGLGWNWERKWNRSDIHWNFSIHDDLAADLNYNKRFFELLWRGNAPFRGETIVLTPLNLNVQYLREYALGFAMPLKGGKEKGGWRIGGRLKYIQGMAGIKMPENHVTMFTEEDGRYISFDFDYAVYEAGFKNFSLWNFNGHGGGVDLGITKYLDKRMVLRATIRDLGFVRYHKNTRSFKKDRSVRYEGLVIDNLYGGNPDIANTDSLQRIFTPDEDNGEAFTMPLATNISFQAGYNIRNGLFQRNDQAWITYMLGVSSMPGAARKPFLNIGYKTSILENLKMVPNFSLGGYNETALGWAIDYDLHSKYRFTAYSGNVLPIINREWGTGVEYGFMFSFLW